MKRPPTRRDDRALDETRLARRYADLLMRYRGLVARLNDDARNHLAFQRLSWFALQRTTSALAMFRDGRVVLANPRWHALATARKGPAGWTVGDAPRQRDYDDLATLAATELERGPGNEPLAFLAQRRDGKCILRVRLEHLEPGGEASLGLLVADDVTADAARELEMGALREQVKKREQFRALGRMAAGVTHDLGNTLNALALRVQRLSRSAMGADPAHLEAIDEAIDMMRLTLERLDRFSGRRTRPAKPVQLRKVIDTAVSLAGLRARKRRGELQTSVRAEIRLPHRLPRVLADANELCSVFVNLLINARDAMPDGGLIVVDASVGARRVLVRVSDSGPGFAPAHLERLFEPFFTTKGARGSGLGLSLAYGFMEAIGGSIRAANRNGGGAELTLELPIASPAR